MSEYLFGWRQSDFTGSTTVCNHIANPHRVLLFEDVQNEGFTVTADATVQGVQFHFCTGSGSAFRVYLYDRATDALLAASAETVVTEEHQIVPVPSFTVTTGQQVAIAVHTSSYLSVTGDDVGHAYFYIAERDLIEGPPDPWDITTKAGNQPKRVVYAVGTLGAVSAPVPGITETPLTDATGAASVGTLITRTITAADSSVLFIGTQTSDASTGVLPAIDLSETAASVGDVVTDTVALDNATAPGLKSVSVLRTLAELGA